MQILALALYGMMLAFLAVPAMGTECANAGAAPAVAPDDTSDAYAIACGHSAVAGGNSSNALGYHATSSGDFSTSLGYTATSAGNYSMALGWYASSAGTSSTALGDFASSVGNFSTAIGYYASAAGSDSMALGWDASSAGNGSTALGYTASSPADTSTALGYGASSSGYASIALGAVATSSGENSTALGRAASSAGARSTAVGFRAFANQPDTVILGSIAGVNDSTIYANVGIGTSSPVQALDVERSEAAARFQLTSFTDSTDEAPQYIQRRARGTRLAPTAVQNNDNLGLFSFRGHNGTAMGGSRATITAQAAGNFTGASTPTRLIFATTPVGSTTPQQVLVITPDGKVQVNGVNLNVPDYVFEDDYQLMPLEELRSFIDTHGHLPGIPSADEVNSEGLDLAGSQMGQLQKIEELTLYTLQQQELIQQQQMRIAHLESHESRLDAQQKYLEAQQKRIEQLEAQLNRALAALD